MAPIEYLVLRTIRHFMPVNWVKWLLNRHLIIKPGMETKDPDAAVARYLDTLHRYNQQLEGRDVFILGYGGRFSVGVALLEAGARHVTLCDPYATPDLDAARTLSTRYPEYLRVEAERVDILDPHLELLTVDVRALPTAYRRRYNLVLSSSVFEHLDDPRAIAGALADITAEDGFQMHFIDLRDHYAKYPFEMLCYSEGVWGKWLNPTSNLNRFRIADYVTAFETVFTQVEWEALSQDVAAFQRTRPRIQSQFLSGDDAVDSITRILLIAQIPS